VDVRARVFLLAAAVLLLVTAAARSEVARTLESPFGSDRPAVPSAPVELATVFEQSAIASVPVQVVPASDRPVVAGARRAEGQRAASVAPTGDASAAASVPLAWDVALHGSLITVGPLALGLTRRGPPASGDR
jgi:hypothetical protein